MSHALNMYNFALSYVRNQGKIELDWIPMADNTPIKVIEKSTGKFDIGEYTIVKNGSSIEVREYRNINDDFNIIETVRLVHGGGKSAIEKAVIKFLNSWSMDLSLLDLDSYHIVPGGVCSDYKNNNQGEDQKESSVVNRSVITSLFGRYKVFMGSCQSGKTAAILSVSVRLLISRLNSIIVLRNTNADLSQIKSRIQGMMTVMGDFFDHNGFDRNSYPVQILEKDMSDEDFRSFVTGIKPSILICIAHAGNLAKLTARLPEDETRLNYALFIDESDQINSSNSGASIEIDKLAKNAYTCFGVSATVMDTLMLKNIFPEDVIRMRINDQLYHGHLRYKFCSIPEGGYSTKITDNLLEVDSGLETFLDDFSSFEPEYADYWDDYMPRMCLICVGDTVSPMKKLFDYNVAVHGDEIVTILITGDGGVASCPGVKGIEIYSKALLEVVSIKLADGTQGIRNGNIWRFRDTCIQHVIGYLRNNGGVEDFPRIIIIAGEQLAGRGVSFVSGDCTSYTKLGWHITDLRVRVHAHRDGAELLQITGRGAGNFADGIRVRLWCEPALWASIRRLLRGTNELVDRAIKADDGENMSDRIQEVPMNRQKIDKHHSLTKNAVCNINIVEGKDGGLGLMHYLTGSDLYKAVQKIVGRGASKISDIDDWRLIDPTKLAKITRRVYDEAIIYLNLKRGREISRGDLLTPISSTTTLSYHSVAGLFSVLYDKGKPSNSQAIGLLIRKSGSKFIVKLN